MKCLICSDEMTLLFAARDYRRPTVLREWPVCWCARCRFGRIDAELTPSEVSGFYAVDYYTHHNGAEQPLPRTLVERIRTHIAWRLDFGRDLSPSEIERKPGVEAAICDVGCGNGNLLRSFKSAGYRVTGVEPDDKARAVAAQAGPVYQGTAEQLPAEIAGSRFDVVLLSHVLEHCVDPAAALSNIKQILLGDGVLVIEVPNNDALGFLWFGPSWPWSDIPRHLNFFTLLSLERMLNSAGFEIQNKFYTGFVRQFSPEWMQTQDLIRERIGVGKSGTRLAWPLLFSTIFASKGRKYDSIRIHARLRQ